MQSDKFVHIFNDSDTGRHRICSLYMAVYLKVSPAMSLITLPYIRLCVLLCGRRFWYYRRLTITSGPHFSKLTRISISVREEVRKFIFEFKSPLWILSVHCYCCLLKRLKLWLRLRLRLWLRLKLWVMLMLHSAQNQGKRGEGLASCLPLKDVCSITRRVRGGGLLLKPRGRPTGLCLFLLQLLDLPLPLAAPCLSAGDWGFKTRPGGLHWRAWSSFWKSPSKPLNN